MYRNTELRHLPVGYLCTVATILETNNDWKKVIAHIPRNPLSEYFEPKYNSEHIQQIEDHARSSNRKCAEILFDEWGTSGRIRPTLSTLRDVVQKAEIYRAADQLAELLQESLPTRPQNGPAAPIDTNISLMMEMSAHNRTTAQMESENKENGKSLGNRTTAQVASSDRDLMKFSNGSAANIPHFSKLDIKTLNGIEESEQEIQGNGYQTSLPNISDLNSNNNSSGIATEILTDEKLIHFEYNELEKLTKRFADRLIYTHDTTEGKLAGKVGSGGFGDVFVGWHPRHGHIAIKKAKSHAAFDRRPEIALKVFNAEVKYLSQFRHDNIVPIIGFSKDGPSLCIVCKYIGGGSLEQKLAAKILTEKQRLLILLGTAEGLKYLHKNEKLEEEELQNPVYRITDSDTSTKKNNFVHGDVKTANILLTRDYIPKLCDFGLAKQYESTFVTTSPMGTFAYMAPEGLTGSITQKIDIYSYGIVVLEVLTGLRPLVPCNGEKLNIKDYVEEYAPNNDITNLLDPFTDNWTKAKELFQLAQNCLERQRKSRPTSEQICERLYEIMAEKTQAS